MIESPLIYLLTLALSVTLLYLLERYKAYKLFQYFPVVVMIYTLNMLFASFGLFANNSEIHAIYVLTKENLLPAMLFLMLLQVDFKQFVKLGRKLLLAYSVAVVSLLVAFIVVAYIFSFSKEMAGAFGALAGSWMGGTANMIAVGSALEVPEDAFAYALVVDSVNYTIWVAFLLFLVPFASSFNRFTKSDEKSFGLGEIGCACSMGAPKYWLIIALALFVSLITQLIAEYFVFISKTITIVLFSTLFGLLLSFTKLKELQGSSELATTMLYLIVALIGSQAIIENISGVVVYIVAGFTILFIHALLMVLGAKLFKLDLFSIGVASLANIGGVASAPILAAAYDKRLVSIGVLMAVMGYLIGTFGGLFVGNILLKVAV